MPDAGLRICVGFFLAHQKFRWNPSADPPVWLQYNKIGKYIINLAPWRKFFMDVDSAVFDGILYENRRKIKWYEAFFRSKWRKKINLEKANTLNRYWYTLCGRNFCISRRNELECVMYKNVESCEVFKCCCIGNTKKRGNEGRWIFGILLTL